MFETNSRACDIRQVMKKGPQPPVHSGQTHSPPLRGLGPGSAPSHTLQPGTPASPVSSHCLLSPCLLLQSFGRAFGSVSTPSAPISFFLFSPALTASQVTSAGAFPASSPDTSPHRNPHAMGALVPVVWRRKWAQTGWGTGFRKAAADPVLNPRQGPGQSHS